MLQAGQARLEAMGLLAAMVRARTERTLELARLFPSPLRVARVAASPCSVGLACVLSEISKSPAGGAGGSLSLLCGAGLRAFCTG